MRPLRLEIEGFTVYKKPQVIDFEKLSFFIIQGRTGAGKTSIVDAITYALYGKVPRYGDSKATKHVISKGSHTMRVALDFSVGGRRYRVERYYNSKIREDQARAYEDGRRLNLTKTQIEEWVEKVTGLDYRTFTKVILLPQGEFDRFLKPKQPKERREILINLLDLEVFERMRQIASEIFREKEGELSALKEEFSRIKDATEEKLKEVENEERTLEESSKNLQEEVERIQEELKALGDLERIEEAIRDLKREIEAVSRKEEEVKNEIANLEKEKRKLEEEEAKLPDLKRDLENVVKDLERVRSALEILEEIRRRESKVKELRRDLEARRNSLKDTEDRLRRGKEIIEDTERALREIEFDEERYIEVLREADLKKRLEKSKRKIERIRAEIQRIESKVEALTGDLEDISGLITVKEEDLRRREVHLYAHRIRSSLKRGETCPVCGGVFEGENLPHLEADVTDLREEVENLSRKKVSLEKEVSILQGELKRLREEEKEIAAELKDHRGLLERDVEAELRDLTAKREEIQNLQRKLETYRKRYEELVSQKEEVLREVERISTEVSSLEADLEERREKLKALTGDQDPEERRRRLQERKREIQERIELIERRRDQIRSYEEDLKRTLTYVATQKENLGKNLADLEKQKREVLTKIAKLRGDVSLEEKGSLERKLEEKRRDLTEVLKQLGEIRNAKEQLKEKISRKKEIQERISKLEDEIRVYRTLAEDLRSDRLQNFAASIMLMRIVDRSSQYLYSFTGSYELTMDGKGNLIVIDRVQGVEREVSSLSGGETFLASLSLALGVSDVLSSQANLESLFIDEGFGSLDDETRERVSEILEVVRININRMVGIISHLPDLAERFHQRIVVRRHGDHSTVEVIC